MSKAEVYFDRRISARRKVITDIDRILNSLNHQFPGERKKPTAKRDPLFEAQRPKVLVERRILSSEQRIDRISRRSL